MPFNLEYATVHFNNIFACYLHLLWGMTKIELVAEGETNYAWYWWFI